MDIKIGEVVVLDKRETDRMYKDTMERCGDYFERSAEFGKRYRCAGSVE